MRFRHYTGLYLAYMKNAVWRFSQYPLDTCLTASGLFIRELSTLAGILAIAGVAGSIGGWSVYELCMVFAFTAMAEALSTLFVSSIWDIGLHMRKGAFDVWLTKPAPVFFQMVAPRIHYPAILSFLIPFGILIYSMSKLQIIWSFGTILFIIECLLCGMLMNSGIYLVANSLNFWIIRGNVADMVEAVREFARYPMHIFPGVIQVTLSVFIPFGFIGYYPTMYLIGKTPLCVPILVLAVTAIAGTCGFIMWHFGMKGYNSTGT